MHYRHRYDKAPAWTEPGRVYEVSSSNFPQYPSQVTVALLKSLL